MDIIFNNIIIIEAIVEENICFCVSNIARLSRDILKFIRCLIYFGYTKELEYIMIVTISKWGNSQGLRLPKDVMKELNLSIGDKVKFFIQNDKIILEPVKKTRKKYNINELVKQIPSDYKPYEEFDSKSGIEEW